MNNYINQSVHNDKVEQLSKQLQQEKLLKQQVFSDIFENIFTLCLSSGGQQIGGNNEQKRHEFERKEE